MKHVSEQVSRIRTILFDLDGTLLDTAPDLAAALNRLRGERGLAELPFPLIRERVSHGAYALLELGFGLARDDPAVEPLRDRLLELYAEKLFDQSRLFPGMDAVLDALEAQRYCWGIVTNKPGFLTEPLLAAVGLAQRIGCAVSGDTVAQRKPHPDPLLHAAELCGSAPAACLYVGDAERDIRAAKAAGMPSLVAHFGYIGRHEDPWSWGADGHIRAPEELLEWLAERQR